MNELNLRRRLNGHGLRGLQVEDFLLETIHRIVKVFDHLHGHGIVRIFRIFIELRQYIFAALRDFFFPGEDVVLQLAEIFHVFVVEFVEYADVFQQLHPGAFQLGLNLVDVAFNDFVAGDKFFDGALSFFHEGKLVQEGFPLQGGKIQILHVEHEIRHHGAYVAGVFRFHFRKNLGGKLRHALLRIGAVDGQGLGVAKVDGFF